MTLSNPRPIHHGYQKRKGKCENCGETYEILDLRGNGKRRFCRDCAKGIRQADNILRNRRFRQNHRLEAPSLPGVSSGGRKPK